MNIKRSDIYVGIFVLLLVGVFVWIMREVKEPHGTYNEFRTEQSNAVR